LAGAGAAELELATGAFALKRPTARNFLASFLRLLFVKTDHQSTRAICSHRRWSDTRTFSQLFSCTVQLTTGRPTHHWTTNSPMNDQLTNGRPRRRLPDVVQLPVEGAHRVSGTPDKLVAAPSVKFRLALVA